MSLPIRVLIRGHTPPEVLGIHEVVGCLVDEHGERTSGVFLAIENAWVKTLVPAPEPSVEALLHAERDDLDDVSLYAKWKPRLIPADVMYRIIKFFREIRDRHHTEVAVLLHYSDAGGWGVSVPAQEVTGGHVSYSVTPEDRVPGTRMIGTMHSHVDMSAFHSGVDEHDEGEFDGLHVTIGRIKQAPERLDLDAELVIRGHRFNISPAIFTDGIEDAPPPKRKHSNWWYSAPTHRVRDVAAYRAVEVPAEWHDPVAARRYRVFDWDAYFPESHAQDDPQSDVTWWRDPSRRYDA